MGDCYTTIVQVPNSLISRYLRSFLRQSLGKFGYSISRFPTKNVFEAQKIDFVIDVGANTGQFGNTLRNQGYEGWIYSIEPIQEAHSRLTKIANRDVRWVVMPPTAVGDAIGTVDFHISYNSVSSSVLKINDRHIESAKNSRISSIRKVPLVTLDELFRLPSIDLAKHKVALKVDVQGYEDRVIDGAKELIKQISVIQLELSLKRLYADQVLFMDMLTKISKLGFELWSIQPNFYELESSRVLQVDATFVRSEPELSSIS